MSSSPTRERRVREFTAVVRRLTALALLTPELDANYEAVRGGAYRLPAGQRDGRVTTGSPAVSLEWSER